MKLLYFLLILTISISCNEFSGKFETPEEMKTRKFHTAEQEGFWHGKAESHLPVVRFLTDDRRVLEVTVPLAGTEKPYHYIEKIILMRDDTELEVKKLKISPWTPKVNFVITDLKKGNYAVVVKCNLHGIWRTDLGDLTMPQEGRQ